MKTQNLRNFDFRKSILVGTLFQFYISATLPRYDEVGYDYDYANQHAYQPIEEGNAALSL